MTRVASPFVVAGSVARAAPRPARTRGLTRLAYGGVQGVTRLLGGSVDGALALLAALNGVLGADDQERLTCPKPVVGVEFHSHAQVGIRGPGQERIARS